MPNFLSLTLPNGQPLAIPASSVVFLEALDADAKATSPNCKSGLFFDLGNGPQATLAQEPFPKLAKAMRAARPEPLVEVTTANKAKAIILVANIIGLRGLADDHPNDGRCQITHRVGPRILPLDVIETYDAITAAMALPTSEGTGDGDETQE